MTSWRERWRRGLMAIGPALAFGARERVEVERLPPLESRILGEARTIDVFLPRGYRSDTLGRYPVLYANDGQDMSTVDLAGVLDSLQASGAMSPALVVAIHATERIEDYGTAGIPNAQELGIRSARYQQFLLEEVMPVIETRYRVETGPDHTAMMGWSLGGLSAFDLTWLHSDRFGSVGVFSGSFWWRTDDSSPAAKQASRIMHRRIRETSVRPSIRMWFQTGMHDESSDRDGDGVIDAIQDTEELIAELVRKGYHRGTDIVDLTVEGKHDLPTWKRLLPEFLKWAFPSRREG